MDCVFDVVFVKIILLICIVIVSLIYVVDFIMFLLCCDGGRCEYGMFECEWLNYFLFVN